MPIVHWIGAADAVAQIDHVTPAHVEIGDIFRLLIDGQTVAEYTAQAGTVADVTAGLVAAWNSSPDPRAAEVTASDETTHLALTADNPGVPFLVTTQALDAGGTDTQTLTLSSGTANAGPHDWSTPANWSSGSVPTGGDDVILDGPGDIRWLPDAAQSLNSLRILSSFTGRLGLDLRAFTLAGGTTTDAKPEHRPAYLKLDTASVRIGEGEAGGSPRVHLDVGSSTACALVVHSTPRQGESTSDPPLRLLGDHSGHSLTLQGGVAAVADRPGQTATFDTMRVGPDAGQEAKLTVGPGVSYDRFEAQSGTHRLETAPATSLEIHAGEVTVSGSQALDTVELRGGTLRYHATGTITTLHARAGEADFRGALQTAIVTTANVHPGAVLAYDADYTTFTTLSIQANGPRRVVVN